jgi:peptidoglycan/LPS O-acetylase OafA/YrhL
MNYRKDIDGLRALAVIPVVLFHAGFPWFKGGFIGVDVFFVISGYLITSIILSEKALGTYTLQKFYLRRARRILPALFFVMLACVVAAWLWLLPYDMLDFSQSVVATTGFVSNIFFWLKTGYFDVEAEFKPLLHTWSLAVEEQYYLLFPLLAVLLLRGSRWPLFWGISLLALVSIAYAQWGAYYSPSSNFFLFPSRFWELGVGALIALYLFERPTSDIATRAGHALGLFGLALIVGSIFLFDRHTPYPSVYTLAPVIGTACIVLFSRPSTLAYKLLSNPLLVGIGLISYSAYLWHQPLLAFARYRTLGEISHWLALLIVVLTFGLAWLTWKFIERPFRNVGAVNNRTAILGFVVLGLCLIAFGLGGHITRGYPHERNIGSLSSDYLSLAQADRKLIVGVDGERCVSGGPSMCRVTSFNDAQQSILLLGDSHSADLTNQFRTFASARHLNAWQMSITGCAFLVTQLAGSPSCQAARALLLAKINEHKFTDVLIVGNYFDHTDRQSAETRQVDIAALVQLMTEILQAGTRVTFFMPRPAFEYSPLRVASIGQLKELSPSTSDATQQEWKSALDKLSAMPNFSIFDQGAVLLGAGCGQAACFSGHTKDHLPLYRDATHLTEFGSTLVFDAFEKKYLSRFPIKPSN